MYIKGNNLKYAQMIDKIKIKQQAQRRDWLTHDSTHHYMTCYPQKKNTVTTHSTC